jgi:transposase
MSVSIEKRIEIISLKKNTDYSNREIASRLGVSEKCVRTSWKNFEENGKAGEKRRIGRPKLTSVRDVSLLTRQVRQNPRLSAKKLAGTFQTGGGKVLSRRTVNRILNKEKLFSNTAVRKPLLKSDYIKRRKWCKERLDWSTERWKLVIFSDESNFEVINRKSRIKVRRMVGERFLKHNIQSRIQGGGGSVGIWGCISGHGSGVCQVYSGRMNQHNYKDVLENNLIPSIEVFYSPDDPWIFQQDGAPCHTANSIKAWLAENGVVQLPWPARSPDLNPIENIWSWMDHQLSFLEIKSLDELKDALHQTWLKIPSGVIDN